MLEVRKSEERGVAEHGWLSSQHSFSFANEPRVTVSDATNAEILLFDLPVGH